MIALVLTQLAARWGQALTLLLLSAAATVAAASPPVYARAVDTAAIEQELAAAGPADLLVSIPPSGREWQDPPEPLEAFRAAAAELTGFTTATTVHLNVRGLRGPDPAATDVQRMAGRDGFCRYVTFRAGRCPVGSREAALPVGLADEAGRQPGDELTLTPMVSTRSGWSPDGPPVTIVLVGVFEATDPAHPYWFGGDLLGARGLPPAILTNRVTVQTIQHGQELVSLDAIPDREWFTPQRIPQLRRQIERAEQELIDPTAPSGAALGTDLPRLLDRISGHGEQARALLPIATAPLVALCWLVVYLAVGHEVSGRRQEAGMVALRGLRRPVRGVAVTAETLAPLLAGVAAGLLLTPLLVAVVGPDGGTRFTVGGEQLFAAGVAAAGTVFAALLALRRELAAPVVQLLRRVPPRRRTVTLAGEALVVALAVVVVAELHGFDGELVGVMVAAPAVVMLAVAVLAARAVRPVIDLAGRWSLRRGRLGPAMAALSLARRPGAARLLVVVLALALGLLGFAVTSTDVAAQGRLVEARRAFGADRVLDVGAVDRGELLRAVRAADPQGRYAMAVLSVPGGARGQPPAIAADTTRLARVALWSPRYGMAEPARLTELLRPPAAEPVLIGDGELAADISVSPGNEDRRATMSLVLVPVAGGQPVAVGFDPVTPERLTYRSRVTGCPDGCRLAAVGLTSTQRRSGFSFTAMAVTLEALRLDGREVGPAGWLADAGRWRTPAEGRPADHLRATVQADGLRLSQLNAVPDEEYRALTVDVPYPLPVVTAGEPPAADLMTGLDRQPIRVAPQASLDGLPGVGARGVLMDLEYAERLSADPGTAVSPQVWLAAGIPQRVVDRLRDEGLVIVDDRTVDQLRTTLDSSGGAQALRFYLLATGLAVLLGLAALALVTAVDRRSWSRGLRDLRAQGLPGRTATAAAVWSYGGVVVAGGVAGALAAGAAWLAAGDRLPFGVDESVLSFWPEWRQVLLPGLAVVAALLAAAVAGAWWQRAAVREVRD